MEWYYAEGQQQIGPISDDEFRSLVNNGTILSNTLVWNSSLTDWVAYGKLVADEPGDSRNVSQTVAGPKINCSECGRAFSKDEMIQYEDSWVCAACKPVFVQKIKEGVTTSQNMEYAGFWIRFGAKIIDGFILWAVQMVMYVPIMVFFMPSMPEAATPGQPPEMGKFITIYGIFSIMQLAVSVAYPTWFLGKFSATPGKMACKIKVVTSDGGKITYLRAFARFFAEWVSAITLGIGYLMAAFDDQKRALHDHICSTRVVQK